MNRRQLLGMSLPEMLVGLMVFSLALTLLSGFLVYSLRHFRKQDPHSTTQRLMIRCLNRLCEDFRNSPGFASNLIYPSGQASNGDLALSLYSSKGPSTAVEEGGTGACQFQQEIVYYREAGTNRLRRRTTLLAAPIPNPVRMLDASLVSAAQSGVGELLANQVLSFQALQFEGGQPTSTIARRLRFRLQMRTAANEDIELNLPAVALLQ